MERTMNYQIGDVFDNIDELVEEQRASAAGE